MRQSILSFLAGLLALALAASPAAAGDPENTLYMDLKDGRVVIELRPDLAPKHVARIKELVRQGFYDGLTFHRVLGGFMAQTGDPKGDGTGGSGRNIPAEFSNEPFRRGTVGMAHSPVSDDGDSQFFICYARTRHLDGKYTVWGKVTKGMGFVGNIKRGNPNDNGTVINPDKIVRMRVAADVKN
ncbi:MAG: peptidylprolyl isomerase [Hyphomicrobiales bacterium]|nr:peptidylprolyl isomerase [Hyphomicrobiales bacterium]